MDKPKQQAQKKDYVGEMLLSSKAGQPESFALQISIFRAKKGYHPTSKQRTSSVESFRLPSFQRLRLHLPDEPCRWVKLEASRCACLKSSASVICLYYHYHYISQLFYFGFVSKSFEEWCFTLISGIQSILIVSNMCIVEFLMVWKVE